MNYAATDVKKLREETGATFNDCKNALAEAGSWAEAVKILEARSSRKAEKIMAAGRETKQGGIFAYVHHNNSLGVLLELNCSTDFVARSDEFKNLARELTMQIAGVAPIYISFEDVPEATLTQLRQEAENDPEVQKRPEKLRAQIVEGKVKKQLSAQILLEQPWIKDDKITVGKLVDEVIRKTGENIVVRRFTRYALGE